jgi:hypothetical protein
MKASGRLGRRGMALKATLVFCAIVALSFRSSLRPVSQQPSIIGMILNDVYDDLGAILLS